MTRKYGVRHQTKGWRLHDNARNLVKRQSYFPPKYYEAMRISPPPEGPYQTGHKLKKFNMQKTDQIRKDLSIYPEGRRVIPWWFQRTREDEAIGQVRSLVKQGVSMQDAVAQVKEEFNEEAKELTKEMNIIKQQAENTGSAVAPKDAIAMLIAVKKNLERQSTSEFESYKWLF
eukprot:gb/GECH01013128.1/.p1 GENE.gb/GECH01013128.1/~~gb/GECH01013128.1/.p1  ORF type:complete len:173 (+),score=56.55 gb/GECH01013128.1/:1-519(+)